eukprot:TRINITY_DN2044_c3_g1_i1.p1 TRINITY_DN2044_c3_g1~~TRINITY_DN2044_c3_g1_i1.p1  ORF type:complete len:515 (+),score=109.60 TRINITY_DN2044_c3_g1_i1:42-1586(+)
MLTVLSSMLAVTPPTRPNVLHLVADDLRPQLGCYGQSEMKTPNLDELAATGLVFSHAYTNFAYCAPSRNSFMSGRRPDRTRALNFLTTFRMAPGGEDWVTMPQLFKNAGYFTSSAGKVYHDHMDDPASWTYPSNQTKWISCQEGDIRPAAGLSQHAFCGVTNESKITYTDEDLILHEGLKRMELAHESGKPWWVSIGVHRPHVSFRVPAGFYGNELYPGDVVKPPKHPEAPSDLPFMAGNWDYTSDDIGDSHHHCQACTVPTQNAIEYRRWYYAAVTWTDHNMGLALQKLKDLGEYDNTIVMFHADHGWQLGELNEWSKKTNTELATHIPMLIRVPWKTNSIGKKTNVRMELVDLYRTVADLAGLTNIQDSVQGKSVAAALDDPSTTVFEEKAAFSQIGRCQCQMQDLSNTVQCGLNACCRVAQNSTDYNFMGYTMRTKDYRYTTWVSWNHTASDLYGPSWEYPNGHELYNLTTDTGMDFDYDGYSVNLAYEPGYQSLVQQLHQQLKDAVMKMH